MLKNKLSASEVARRVWGTTKDSRGYDVARNRDRIGHYLSGTSYPEPENLVKLAEAVGVPVEELQIERPDPPLNPGRGQAAGDIHLTVLSDQPGKARIRLDRVVDVETALRVLQMIREDERKAFPMPPTGRSFGKPEPELRGPVPGPETVMLAQAS